MRRVFYLEGLHLVNRFWCLGNHVLPRDLRANRIKAGLVNRDF